MPHRIYCTQRPRSFQAGAAAAAAPTSPSCVSCSWSGSSARCPARPHPPALPRPWALLPPRRAPLEGWQPRAALLPCSCWPRTLQGKRNSSQHERLPDSKACHLAILGETSNWDVAVPYCKASILLLSPCCKSTVSSTRACRSSFTHTESVYATPLLDLCTPPDHQGKPTRKHMGARLPGHLPGCGCAQKPAAPPAGQWSGGRPGATWRAGTRTGWPHAAGRCASCTTHTQGSNRRPLRRSAGVKEPLRWTHVSQTKCCFSRDCCKAVDRLQACLSAAQTSCRGHRKA